MSLNSLDQLLNAILAQPQWEKQRRFNELVKCWNQIINAKVAQNTRPYCLRDDTLFISTSGSVWAQNLSLQRYNLLKKINRRASQPIKELRFSPAKWYPYTAPTEIEADVSNIHPSLIKIDDSLTKTELERSPSDKISNPQEAMKRWFTHIQQQSQSFPLCPNCQASTPPGELKRWGVCSCCFAQQSSYINPSNLETPPPEV